MNVFFCLRRLDDTKVRRLDGRILMMGGPFFMIDIQDFDFWVLSGKRFMIEIDKDRYNPKVFIDINLDEVNLLLIQIRNAKCEKGKGPVLRYEKIGGSRTYLEISGNYFKNVFVLLNSSKHSEFPFSIVFFYF